MRRFLFSTLFLGLAAAAQAQPTDLITAHGRYFAHNGNTFRFVGVNIRGLVHYGQPAPLQYTTVAHIDENLDGVAAFGGKVIRVFAANKHETNASNIARLTSVLDKMEARGQKAIVCLTDLYTTGYNPPGDDAFYMTQPGGFTLLDDTWFAGGFRTNYLPWVRDVVTALKNHNAVFAWQIGNELTDIKTPNNIIPFTTEVAAEIKAIDPWHMVTTGFISVDHTQIGIENGVALYSDPNIDFMTVHSYNGEDPVQNWAVNARVEKPLVMDEFGWAAANGNRVTNTTSQMTKWFDQRLAHGFMHWGYQWQNYDIGDGDGIFGFDRNFFASDYTAMSSLYSGRASAFASSASPLPDISQPTGTNVARNAVATATDSNFSSSFGPDKAIDGLISASSKWTSTGTAPPHWIALDLGSAIPISSARVIMSVMAGEEVGYGFTAYKLQQGTSLSGPWTDLATVDNPAKHGRVITRFAGNPSVRYIRLYITGTGTDNYARLTEFEVYSTNSGVENWSIY